MKFVWVSEIALAPEYAQEETSRGERREGPSLRYVCAVCEGRCILYACVLHTTVHTGPTRILIQVLLSFSSPLLSSPVSSPPSLLLLLATLLPATLLPLLSPRYVDPLEQRSSCSTGWNRTLRHLYMHSNRYIADDTAAVLIKSLRHHPTIVDVGLTDTKVSGAKAQPKTDRLIDRKAPY